MSKRNHTDAPRKGSDLLARLRASGAAITESGAIRRRAADVVNSRSAQKQIQAIEQRFPGGKKETAA